MSAPRSSLLQRPRAHKILSINPTHRATLLAFLRLPNGSLNAFAKHEGGTPRNRRPLTPKF